MPIGLALLTYVSKQKETDWKLTWEDGNCNSMKGAINGILIKCFLFVANAELG